MKEHRFSGLDGGDPLGFMAALGLLRVLAKADPEAAMAWEEEGRWIPVFRVAPHVEPVDEVMDEVERWRAGHPAVDFAVGADRKVQDLKHPPAEFRELMRSVQHHPEAAGFIAAYATGVAVDGTGQTKPTSFHFTAGKQIFLDAVLSVRDTLEEGDVREALSGPWEGSTKAKDTRWRAGSERSRALLSFDPSKEKGRTIVGAVWLAFLSLPLFPAVPSGSRLRTTGFTGHGHRESFRWPLWGSSLKLAEVRTTVGLPDLEALSIDERRRRGIQTVLQSEVQRSGQGYGNFSASRPV